MSVVFFSRLAASDAAPWPPIVAPATHTHKRKQPHVHAARASADGTEAPSCMLASASLMRVPARMPPLMRVSVRVPPVASNMYMHMCTAVRSTREAHIRG